MIYVSWTTKSVPLGLWNMAAAQRERLISNVEGMSLKYPSVSGWLGIPCMYLDCPLSIDRAENGVICQMECVHWQDACT